MMAGIGSVLSYPNKINHYPYLCGFEMLTPAYLEVQIFVDSMATH